MRWVSEVGSRSGELVSGVGGVSTNAKRNASNQRLETSVSGRTFDSVRNVRLETSVSGRTLRALSNMRPETSVSSRTFGTVRILRLETHVSSRTFHTPSNKFIAFIICIYFSCHCQILYCYRI